jgi:GT2 family glycosyltransferase
MAESRNTALLGWIHPGTVAGAFMTSVLDEVLAERESADLEIVGYEAFESGPLIAMGRNRLAEAFLDHPRAPDWLFMIDADMVIPPKALRMLIANSERLRSRGKLALPPVVGGLCFMGGRGRSGVQPTTMRRVEPDPTTGAERAECVRYKPGETLQVDWTGAACLLIHRAVIVAIREHAPPNERHPYFGTDMGEDVTFCRRASEAGARIYVDCSVRCGHIRSSVVDEDTYLSQGRFRRDTPVSIKWRHAR